jgi:sigma-B regulation protein RsbU (phosphoserine phosphatase)
LNETIKVLRSIRSGRLDRKVSVTTNDEIGYAGDVINEMTDGLRERAQLRQALELAREVQQNLLPKSPPPSDRVDIAGRSIYCDQTGGDYFDFFRVGDPEEGKVALLVGDVSGHGISSALLMATARAFLRLRSALGGSIGDIVTDVNRQLAADVEESGQFMTLFYLVIETAGNELRWVRAGHDPAVLYDLKENVFEELGGPGVALGVEPTWRYRESQRQGLSGGQVILIGTDGIWESRNSRGEMFGKQALREIIRNNATGDAGDILTAVTDSLKRFRGDFQPEDDVTLVVLKI